VLEDLRDFEFVDTFATSLVEEKILVHTAQAEAEIACGRASGVITELEALTSNTLSRAAVAQLITPITSPTANPTRWPPTAA